MFTCCCYNLLVISIIHSFRSCNFKCLHDIPYWYFEIFYNKRSGKSYDNILSALKASYERM